MNKNFKFYIKLVFLAIFIFLLFYKVDSQKLLQTLVLVKYPYIATSLLLKIFGIIVSTAVLYFSICMVGEKVKIGTLFKIYFLSYFFNNLGLGSLGGDSYKWVKLNNIIKSKVKTGFSLVNEKIIGFSTLVSFVGISFILYFYNDFNILYYIFTYPLSIIILFILLLVFRWFTNVSLLQRFKVIQHVNNYHFDFKLHDKISIFVSLIFSFLFYVFTILSFFLIYTSLDPHLPLWLAFFVIPVVIFINTIPISFQGIGIREASIAYMFSFLGFSFEVGVTASIILLFVNIIISILSGIYYIKEKHYIK
jgi:uncharacterized protein (TIRG00374 family)